MPVNTAVRIIITFYKRAKSYFLLRIKVVAIPPKIPIKLYPAPKILASLDTKPQGRISCSSKAGKLYVNETIIDELTMANI